ncbi:MAG: glycosyltransferase family 2 protein [Ruminococcaceae bacterium]|nr:glycosyltransferase family 2 protein [Oscillospiraceae bacterium]
MKFSIIVPLYNAARYLDTCISSVLKQTVKDWELILVDDGSTDGSGEFADRYARSDRRIRVIHKRNQGQFRARRDGLRQASGEYILFLDSDDYWSLDCLKTLCDAIEEHYPDVVIFGGERFGDDSRKNGVIGLFSAEARWCEKPWLLRNVISGNDCNSLCLKAIKRTLFDEDVTDYSQFDGFSIGEDKVQLLYPLSRAEKIWLLPHILYYYRYNKTSTVHRMDLNRIPCLMAAPMFRFIYAYAKEWGMDDADGREAMAVYYLRQFLQTYYGVKRSCHTRLERIAFRTYRWRDLLDIRALPYSSSKKLSLKEKIKLRCALRGVYR